MIVNHKYKFIFIKTQKTASTTLEIALSQLCDENDIITPITSSDEEYRKKLGYQSAINYNIPFSKYNKKDFLKFLCTGKRKRFYNHMSSSEIKRYLGKDIYDSYYKFCFERNPYDKLVSLFYHHGGFQKYSSLLEFINKGELEIIKGFDQYTIGKNIAVDDIFKFENLDESIMIISDKLNLDNPLKLPPKKLKSQFREKNTHYSKLINQQVKRKIDIIWARELKMMNYDF
ncbi:Sulfotransferase family protein [Psychroflexus salarius]|uniref:Sulfotransferase family protein n=1 Tax=Psychroflexus salarius TaxID=1155689 RepID=A0A1M4X4R6_9FLAO|nr:sulfotransferase family 2 domain-containing protein [Psychroflexus salarius]SHE88478.1 Sulfotransferase family protein [Psychroflexus salarius]